MEINIHGKQMDVGDALRNHATEKLTDLSHKFFNHTTYITVTFSREGHGHPLTRAHILIQLGKNIMVVADGVEADPYVAFDSALAKAGKQLRRYKNRLRDHHERLEQTPESEIVRARDYVLAMDEIEHSEEPSNDGEGPIVIAEMSVEIQTMSVSDAVMRMDLSDQPLLMFRNASNDSLNVVYRRADGNVGWIDPENIAVAKKRKTA
ncbi:MAG: ribosome-associated translation inhibitor RaiA [Alphaproteobacteria bacterium]|nr:ribosome-associated translation inhibitor RaiA [Alphaproteobacteria bacterium]